MHTFKLIINNQKFSYWRPNMSTPSIINNDPFCDVELYELKELKNKFVVRLKHPETGEMLPIDTKGAIHGPGYRLVSNSRVDQITRDVLTRTGLKWEPLPKFGNSKVTDQEWDGKKFAARYYIPQVNVDVKDSENKTKLMLGVEAVNSYDGTYGVALQFFIMSQACSNQFRSRNLLGGFNFRHHESADSSLEVDLQDASSMLMSQADQFSSILPKVEGLINTTLEDVYGCNRMDAYLQLRSQLCEADIWKPTYEPHVLDELSHQGVTKRMGRENRTAHIGNMWGVLNAYTAVATHHIGGFNGANINRMVTDRFISTVEGKRGN